MSKIIIFKKTEISRINKIIELIESLRFNIQNIRIKNIENMINKTMKDFSILFDCNNNNYKLEFIFIWLNKKDGEYKYEFTLHNLTPPDEYELAYMDYKGK